MRGGEGQEVRLESWTVSRGQGPRGHHPDREEAAESPVEGSMIEPALHQGPGWLPPSLEGGDLGLCLTLPWQQYNSISPEETSLAHWLPCAGPWCQAGDPQGPKASGRMGTIKGRV